VAKRVSASFSISRGNKPNACMPVGRAVLCTPVVLSGAHGVLAVPELFVVPPVIIYQWISAGDEAEREGGGKGKHGEEEHLKRSYAEAG
jgi:hypothetical protein